MKVLAHGRATAEVVPVYVNGHGPFSFLLDPGSTVSSVSRQLASRLGLHQTGSTTKISW